MNLSAVIAVVLGVGLMLAPRAFSQPSTNADTPAESVIKPGKSFTGKASWYGPGFHGRETASGQRFNQNRPTAASNHLPLGTRAVVTNLRNGRSVKVRVNDCGPYVDGRKIDLSKKAAQHLAMTHDGVAPVKIKVEHVPPGAETCQQIRQDAAQSRRE